MSSEVLLQHLEPQPVLSIRAIVPTEQLAAAMGERLQRLADYLGRHGLQPSGPPYVRYHAFSEAEADLELGIPLRQTVTGEGLIVSGLLPGGPAATTWHLSPHDQLGEAYGRLHAWLQSRGRESGGPAWEVYTWIDPAAYSGPEHWPEPARWRTQLIQPLS